MNAPRIKPGDAFELRDADVREAYERKHGAPFQWRVQSVSSASPWAIVSVVGFRGDERVCARTMVAFALTADYQRAG